jgi:hypothetical protein
MANGLSNEKLDKLADAIFAGLSVAQCAKAAGVCERTVRSYRAGVEDDLPKHCGCGRPLKHNGFCMFRRQQRKLPAAPARR